MKNANQIRQFIKNWQAEAGKYTTKTKFEAVLVDVINTKCDSVLTLLPCKTCNGTGKVPAPIPHTCWGKCIPCRICNELLDPCPDCQKKPSNINPAETIAEYPESQPEIPIDKDFSREPCPDACPDCRDCE